LNKVIYVTVESFHSPTWGNLCRGSGGLTEGWVVCQLFRVGLIVFHGPPAI